MQKLMENQKLNMPKNNNDKNVDKVIQKIYSHRTEMGTMMDIVSDNNIRYQTIEVKSKTKIRIYDVNNKAPNMNQQREFLFHNNDKVKGKQGINKTYLDNYNLCIHVKKKEKVDNGKNNTTYQIKEKIYKK